MPRQPKLKAETPSEKGMVNEPVREPKEASPSIDGPGVVAGVPDGNGGLRTPSESSRAFTMLRALASQPKVRTRIPREAKEPAGAFHDVIQNGLHIFVLKGVPVELPEQISAVLEKSYFDTEKAINETKIMNPLSGVFSNARLDMKSEAERQALS